MAFWRVASGAQRHQVAIEGLYHGASAFLVGANPRVLQLDLRLLRLQGIYSMAINNAAILSEPNAVVMLDRPRCFNFNIFTNARILKLMDYIHRETDVEGQRLSRFPNTLFYDCDEQVVEDEFCADTGPMPGWRNTFFVALAALKQMGFANVYMIGCTFDIDKEKAYAYDHHLSDDLVDYNRKTYDQAVDRMKTLVPRIEDSGMKLWTCHERSGLDGIVDYIPYTSAISRCTRDGVPVIGNRIIHANE